MALEGKRQAKIQAEQQGAVREDRRVLLLCISSATLFPFPFLSFPFPFLTAHRDLHAFIPLSFI